MSDESNRHRLSRARLLRQAGAAAATVGLAGCGVEKVTTLAEDTEASQLPRLPPSQAPLTCNVFSFFTPQEARTVEAVAARLIPGTPDDPGAREACVLTYIDQKLARYKPFATPTYFRPPFAKPVKSGRPGPQPGASQDILVRESELYRYGFQSDQTPQQAYRSGVRQLDRYSRRRFGRRFAELTEDQQDAIIEQLEAMDPENPPAERSGPQARLVETIFTKPSAFGFFSMLQDDTAEGMFADAVYGGNRDLAGWRLIRYPGAQRAWTPEEVRRGPNQRRFQGLDGLAPIHPGHPGGGAILPIAGSEEG